MRNSIPELNPTFSGKSILVGLEKLSHTKKIPRPLPVSYSGSVLIKNTWVRQEFLRQLRRGGLHPRPPEFPPSVGAALLALRLGSGKGFVLEEKVKDNLRLSVEKIGSPIKD